MPVLVERIGSKSGREFHVSTQECVLGRQGDPNVSAMFASDSRISRRHARLVADGGIHFLEDLGSRNGTHVNGERITTTTRLEDGDHVRIGGIEFTFHLSGRLNAESRAEAIRTAVDHTQFVDDSAQSSILARADTSFRERQVGEALAGRRKLDALLEMLRKLGASLDIEIVLKELLDGLFQIFPHAGRAFVGLREGQSDIVAPRSVRYRQQTSADPITVSRTITQQVMTSGQSILCRDAESDARYRGSQSILDSTVRSFMCAPMMDADGVAWGMIQLDAANHSSGFTESDLQVLASIAPQAGIAVKYTQVYERELQQQTLIRDLEVARRVQHALLPAAAPDINGYEFHAHYESAREVGGDYYNYVSLPDGRLAVIVADVAGKGVSAALLMAKISGELKAYLLSEPSPLNAVVRLNESLADRNAPLRFVTLALAVIDPIQHHVELVNAGHVVPLCRRITGVVETLGDETCGIPLGVEPRFEYESSCESLKPGEAIVLVTDGITEAATADQNLYGAKRLKSQCQRAYGTAEEIVDGILDDVSAFVDGQPKTDDTCVICIRRVP